jgi:phospholipid/cholesterol/gamma-HCH transport system substrate-binding protein
MISGPDLVAEATALIAEVRGFVSPENRDAIEGILANLEHATAGIDAMTARAEQTLSRADAAMATAEASLVAANGLMTQDIPALVANLQVAVDSTTAAMEGVRGFTQGDLPQLSTQTGTLILDASKVIATFDALARQIGSDPGRFLLGNETPEYRRSP